MGTRRVGDEPGGKPCLNRGHNPPQHMVYKPGVYEHTCPGCGAKQTFVYC